MAMYNAVHCISPTYIYLDNSELQTDTNTINYHVAITKEREKRVKLDLQGKEGELHWMAVQAHTGIATPEGNGNTLEEVPDEDGRQCNHRLALPRQRAMATDWKRCLIKNGRVRRGSFLSNSLT